MRSRLVALFVMCAMAALPAWAQETRGNINGTVRDAQGIIPGATVRITNVDNSQTQQLVTNGSGYFEAPLLPAGNYRVTVEMPSFKTYTQSNIVLSVGQTLSLNIAMEVGSITERVDVTAEAPLLDTTSVSSGQNFDRALLEGLPMAANQPMLLVKFASGLTSPTTQQLVLQGQIDGPNDGAGSAVGGVGSFNYTIDGATNAGNNRRMAASPNSDMIQEMRVETSNFDASMGHGTGASIAMMTRAGTNALRGTVNYQYWTNKLNSWNPQQKLAFAQRPETGDLYNTGHSHNAAFTLGGPVVIPKVIDGRGKLFFFGNYQRNADDSRARNTPTLTVPANDKHLQGDFSDLLTLSNPSQYQIYDPLSTRPNPNQAGSVVRDPFPGNIIPRERIFNPDGSYKSPLMALYADMVPKPNQNFVEQGAIPTGNDYQGGQPNVTGASNFGGRFDYNHSETDRFFFRASGTTFHEQLGDWTYESPNPKWYGTHINDKTRASWSYVGNWTKTVAGATVIDTQLAANRFYEDQQRRGLHKYKPTDVGLPAYLDEFCQAVSNCMLPVVTISGYQGISTGANGALDATNFQAQSNITSVKGVHTMRGGVDYRLAMRRGGLVAGGNVSSTYTFNNTYTRVSNTSTATVSDLGHSLASLMLGLPSSTSIGINAPISIRNPYLGTFFQDTWRVNSNLTLNFGLRYEYEDGIREVNDRWITGFDPDAQLSITDAAQAAYARSPITQVPASQFRVLGGQVYASDSRTSGKTWAGESMWMPRFSGSYKLGERTVIKGGYGLFFDTLNAGDYNSFNQTGYTSSTTNSLSDDFGVTFNLGDPRNGVSPLTNPFPVRASGSRYEPALGDSLGSDISLGQSVTVENPNRKHARVNRWRFGVQRELFRTMAVEIAYTGSYSDRVGMSRPMRYVPEEYYSNVMGVRDTSAQALLQQQVTNPFNIANFAFLATSNPALYQRMQGSNFFTAATVQRQALIQGYPHLNGLTFSNLPMGIVKTHSLEITLNRRYANGLSANAAFSVNRVTENAFTQDYDRTPNRWQTNNSGRPWRVTGGAVYEFPFGNNKPFLNEGGVLSKILGGWQAGGTLEYQPGQILTWNNAFFTGDLSSIKKDNPEIALNRDGTLDQSKYWFNIDGFERNSANTPASFQKRQFPFQVDGLRGTELFLVNMNFVRNFDLGNRRSFQFRLDIQNLFDTPLYSGPQMDPTNTNFGKITAATNSIMRFITFVTRVSF